MSLGLALKTRQHLLQILRETFSVSITHILAVSVFFVGLAVTWQSSRALAVQCAEPHELLTRLPDLPLGFGVTP